MIAFLPEVWLNPLVQRRDFLWALAGLLASGCLARPAGVSTARAAEPPSETELPSILLAAAGDTVLGYNLEAHFDAQIELGVRPEQLWPLYFTEVKTVLDRADLTVVNLECPFTERGSKVSKNFNFRARPELVNILTAGSVNVVTLANNHTMDYGPEGLQDTIATLEDSGITYFGAGGTLAHARRPAVTERRGVKVGFLGYYFQSAGDMLEPRAVYATATSAGVAGCYVDLTCIQEQVTEDIKELSGRVDAVIPYFHWGREGTTDVQDYQVELAHLCIDLGCKAVLGAHPHRFQGVELYRNAPIFYSLGNFVYGGRKDPQDTLSAIALLRLRKDGQIQGDVVPIQVTRWPEAPFQPFVLTGSAGEAALGQIAGLCTRFPVTLPMLRPYLKDKDQAVL